MNAVGILFSGISENSVHELTKERTMASVPFGCRYRLIDFTLSNLVNAGITHVGLITHYNYQSLMDHIGTGKDWDLARRHGGIQLLPPFVTAFSGGGGELWSTWLEALVGVRDFIFDCREDLFVLSDCDSVCNLDLDAMIQKHVSSGAEVTLAVKSSYLTDGTPNLTVVDSSPDGRILDMTDSLGRPGGYADVSLKLVVAGKRFITEAINGAISRGYSDLIKYIVMRTKNGGDCRVFRYDSYFARITDLTEYFRCSMDLLDPDIRRSIFGVRNRPVLTKVRNSAPSTYVNGSVVRNSLIADGCVIEGTVENSIIFRGVKIGKNTHVKNCILMQDTITGSNVYLNCVVTDKNAVIRDGRVLSGHETLPFFIGKNLSV
ncbi:MAG: glucose-1-phosphate adenylyltransferase subunit GlgD [Clostridia bacterium]|nr:glucose-1-phosphate adenylyltransferase subunit GlgD [Clostridia bacterium]MBR4800043.1 glucose-1-phosphate adenylyltransferase subunit GlgD [Clostridia bacterium]